VIEAKVGSLIESASAEIDRIQASGGALAAVENGYMKSALVASHARRRAGIEAGDQVVVGVNAFVETEPSPLTAELDAAIQTVDPEAEADAVESLHRWRHQRDEAAVLDALEGVRAAASRADNLMPATLAAARAGATTGEWTGALRGVFGEFRAPTGVAGAAGTAPADGQLADVREAVRRTGDELGRRLRLLVAKPGLDGHSNGAEQVAVRARDAGFEVIYPGIRLTPEEIVAAAVAEDVHCVGISILSGSHLQLVPAIVRGLRAEGMSDVVVVVGGIVPPRDAETLRQLGVAAVFTPKDFSLTDILARVVAEIRLASGLGPSV
ncbi:MAG TPA: methylmalonyl-CoA mutase family protein, partial [Pseudonocardiaceae bacterium]|nr:methylmalonyl-CoA mutase family protein [Pseudonocardiaceae bacterium]